MLGELLGNYRIVRKLGEGGMGEVYLAQHEGIGTHVAVKLLFPHISTETAHVDRFFNEARAVAKIRHAGIVKISDVGFTPTGRAYLLMEFLEGESLSDRIARGPLPLPAACELGRQIASVLAATHATGVIHRDLKPDNIFLVPDLEQPGGERAKVLDFGIAKLTGALAHGLPTQSQSTMGTPMYMSPEQWGDASKVDARADIYSLGCIVFEALAGRPPFQASSMMEACALHTQAPAPHIRSLVPELPQSIDDLLDRMLAKLPADRPQTAQELVRVFSDLRGSSGTYEVRFGVGTAPAGALGPPRTEAMRPPPKTEAMPGLAQGSAPANQAAGEP
ncbi:MAG TPA: serine/threonine-protein kinase, partial [Kofleriaceae bacterium]|nr:serine/threonine-protein kinase [Kofleriaceae bacterium]